MHHQAELGTEVMKTLLERGRLASIVVLAAAICGCTGETPKPDVADGPKPASQQRPEAKSKPVTPQRRSPLFNSQLPADLADFPLFPDSTVEASVGSYIEVRSPGLVNVVHEFYEPELKKNGWEINKSEVSDGGVHLRADKDSRRVDIGLSWKDGATLNRIIVSEKDNYIPQSFDFGGSDKLKQDQP